MVNPLEITYYLQTGYSPSDEPGSDAVIELNEHWISPLLLKEYNPSGIQSIRVQLSDDDLKKIDYIKIKDTVTNERYYYYVIDYKRMNEKVTEVRIVLDAFATVGLDNISFFGNIARRSLSAGERDSYPLLPEPWAPRRPLKTRRLIIDLNVNKTIRIPSHISAEFSEEEDRYQETQTINVPSSPLALATTPDTLSIDVTLPMGYPNAAQDTAHTITTPWGTIMYTTPFEQYLTLSGGTLAAFLEKAKKYNALDLIETPYFLPNPNQNQNISIPEISNPNINNPKASRYYTTITIRSLASNSAHTYSDNDIDLQFNQPLTIVIAPDKNGGIYVIPSTLRDTGLSAYTYLDGVYSPFETVMYNAIGDTPAKFAADGTTLLNTALNNLFQTYINKVNALQLEGMQAKYFRELASVKGLVMTFVAESLGVTSRATTVMEGYYQNTISATTIPTTTQTTEQSQRIPSFTQTQSQTTNIPAYSQNQNSTTNTPAIYGRQTPPTAGNNFTATQQNAYSAISSTRNNIPAYTQTTSGSVSTPAHNINTSSNTTSNGYIQNMTQSTWIPGQTTNTTTVQDSSGRSVADGVSIAENGFEPVFRSPQYNATPTFGSLQSMLFGSYRNEMHSFMLGNINDYLNRWVSIQNDMHNGKVANLFKNITLLGSHEDYNKLAGKYEILITSLRPEDELNFDLFLDHFGHAVDEYTTTLVRDAGGNHNYTMVGEDAIMTNRKMQEANGKILNQFRTGVRVWKTLIRPENY